MLKLKSVAYYTLGPVICAAVLLGIGMFYFEYMPVLQQEYRLKKYTNIIWKHAQEYSIPTQLVKGVIKAESSVIPDIVSPKGAKGLMQITEHAEADVMEVFGIEKGNPFDPDYNILIGTAYLRILFNTFDNDILFVLAAYNAGIGNVRKWKKEAPGSSSVEIIQKYAFPETREYILSVLKD